MPEPREPFAASIASEAVEVAGGSSALSGRSSMAALHVRYDRPSLVVFDLGWRVPGEGEFDHHTNTLANSRRHFDSPGDTNCDSHITGANVDIKHTNTG